MCRSIFCCWTEVEFVELVEKTSASYWKSQALCTLKNAANPTCERIQAHASNYDYETLWHLGRQQTDEALQAVPSHSGSLIYSVNEQHANLAGLRTAVRKCLQNLMRSFYKLDI